MSETELVKACVELLKLRGALAWRQNTGAAALPGRGGKKQFVRFGVKGCADILGVLPGGRMLAVECKVGRNQATSEQAAFLDAVCAQGGAGTVVRSLDELETWLDVQLR